MDNAVCAIVEQDAILVSVMVRTTHYTWYSKMLEIKFKRKE